jgi:hypothetical protein
MKSTRVFAAIQRSLTAKSGPDATVSVYSLKNVFRFALVLAVIGASLGAISRHSARMAMLRSIRQHSDAVAVPVSQLSAENTIPGTYTTFEVPGSSTGALQGTVAFGMDSAGDITGPYLDTNRVAHGYLRLANGTVTKFDAPGAGNSAAGELSRRQLLLRVAAQE